MAERYAVSECSLVFLIFYLFFSSPGNKMAHPPAKTVVCLATAFSYFVFLISFDINVNINLDMYMKGTIYTRIANCKLLEEYLFRVSQNSWQALGARWCCSERIHCLRVAHLFEESRIRIWYELSVYLIILIN